MPGWLGTRKALRGHLRGLVPLCLAGVLAGTGGAWAEGPAARLGAYDPVAFPAALLADATGGEEIGARLLEVSPAAAGWGLQQGDVVLRVEGQPLGGASWNAAAAVPPAGSAGPTFTVWRAAPGTRQVEAPAALGSRALDEFVALPEAERTPVRLAVMLANQGTLVQPGGGGVVLVPADSLFDSARWLRCATPLPPASEAASEIAKAMRKRTRMPPAPGGDDVAEADRDLQRGKPFEARERAQRAIVAQSREPEHRGEPGQVAEAVRIYSAAELELQRREAMRTMPEPFFAIVAEGSASFVQDFLPQQSLMNVQQSWGWGAQGGVRVRLAPAGIRVISNTFLLAEIGYYSNEFDDLAGNPFFQVGLTQYSLEFMYRPPVAAQLRPYLRGGVGFYSFAGKSQCGGGSSIPDWSTVVNRWETGAIFGGGMDVLRIPSLHLRASVNATYRILHSKFGPESDDFYTMECASNTASDLELEDGIYNLDLDGVQLGIMLTFVP